MTVEIVPTGATGVLPTAIVVTVEIVPTVAAANGVPIVTATVTAGITIVTIITITVVAEATNREVVIRTRSWYP